MLRKDLEHIIRASCAILQIPEIYIFGSQSILGEHPELSNLIISEAADVNLKQRQVNHSTSYQKRSDRRSKRMHLEVLRELREHPQKWEKPLQTISKWEKLHGGLFWIYIDWRRILQTWSKLEICKFLVSNSPEAKQYRSSSPFVGIISNTKRNEIFRRYQFLVSRPR